MPFLDIFYATCVIPNAEIRDVVVERIAGEVAAPHVLVDASVDIVPNNAALVIMSVIVIRVIGSCSKCRNFNNLPTKTNVGQPESPADQATIGEQSPNLIRCRIGGNVKILGMQHQHCIAHTPAHQERLVSRLVQPIKDFQRAFGKLVPGDIVSGAGNDLWSCGLRGPAIFQSKFRLSIGYAAV